ncbi:MULTISPECIES: hypothetical protein [unclassified Streptomyces]|uniref:hypothetical protein n=1 Tax=unclassified Streptomyces TaxID=2593676 RepID=UPI003806EE0E
MQTSTADLLTPESRSDNRPGNPDRPSIARRAVAWSVDFALVLAAAYAIGVHTAHQISDVWSNAPHLGLSTWQIVTGDGGAIGKAGHLATSLWHQVVVSVIQGFLLLAATTFAYHWATLTFAGRTLGKVLVGVRITPHTPGRAAARAAVTTLADVGCFAFACCLLVSGHLVWAVLAWLGAVAAFWFNALSAYSGRTVADRVAGTVVVYARTSAHTPAPSPQPQPFASAAPPMPQYEPQSTLTP